MTDNAEKKGLSRRGFIKGATVGSIGALSLLYSRGAEVEAAPPPERWDREEDVIVVGSGFAGLAAAVEAHDAGAKTIILEKRVLHGGNSTLAMGAFGAVDPARQEPLGIEDSIDKHFTQTLAGGDYRADPAKVRYLVEHALEDWQWLESMGVELQRPVYEGYGALWPRWHVPQYKTRVGGAAIITALLDQTKSRGIPLLLEHKITQIYREEPFDGSILGVQVEIGRKRLNFRARRGVVLAAGGFAADKLMRQTHDPRLTPDLNVSGHSEATGEIIRMAISIGAYVTGMDYIQSAPGRPPGRKYSSGFILLPARMVILSKEGKRIIAEDERRDVIANTLLARSDQTGFLLVDQDGFEDQTKPYQDRTREALEHGDVWQADTLEELAGKMGIAPTVLRKTVDQFNEYVDKKEDPDFGRNARNMPYKIQRPPFWGAPVGVYVHHTMGGLCTEGVSSRVVDLWGKSIPGLFAAGEVTGGIHGSNRIGGTATVDCIVYGRIAGKGAAS